MQPAPTLTLALSAVLATAGLSRAQDTVPSSGQGFTLEPKEYTLEELLDRAATYLHRNYLVQWTDNRRNTPDTVFLQQKLELDATGCEEVVSQLLYSCGWVMTPVDEGRGIYEWINVSGSRRGEISARSIHMEPKELLRRKALKVHVTTAAPVEHVNPANASQILADQTGAVCFASGNRIVLTGYMDSVANGLLTLKAMDQPGGALDEGLESRLTDIERDLQSAQDRLQSTENRIQEVEKKISK